MVKIEDRDIPAMQISIIIIFLYFGLGCLMANPEPGDPEFIGPVNSQQPQSGDPEFIGPVNKMHEPQSEPEQRGKV